MSLYDLAAKELDEDKRKLLEDERKKQEMIEKKREDRLKAIRTAIDGEVISSLKRAIQSNSSTLRFSHVLHDRTNRPFPHKTTYEQSSIKDDDLWRYLVEASEPVRKEKIKWKIK